MKWVYVAGGGVIQLPLIEEFTTRGYRVCVGDQDPLCPASKLDNVEVFLASSHNPHASLRLAQEYEKIQGEGPSGVMCAGTDVGPTVSLIAEHYHLPGVPFNIAVDVKDKLMMRDKVKLPHPWWDGREPREYPCVQKPRYLSGSQGVKVLRTPDDFTFEMDTLWEEILSPHEEASTDWFIDRGYPVYMNGAERWFSGETFGLEVGWVNPFIPPVEVYHLATHASRELGVHAGPFKMDLIRDSRYGWSLLECATRWSGSFDHTVGATLSTNRNLTATLVDYALGEPFDTKRAFAHVNIQRYVGCYTPQFTTPYQITKGMLEELRTQPHVIDVKVIKWSGEPTLTLRDRPLFIFASGNNSGSAKAHAMEAWLGWLELTRSMNKGGGDV